MLSIPEHVSVQCPRCSDDIVLAVDVIYTSGILGDRLTAQVADYAGPLEQHYRDAGHVDVDDTVAVNVHTICLN